MLEYDFYRTSNLRDYLKLLPVVRISIGEISFQETSR